MMLNYYSQYFWNLRESHEGSARYTPKRSQRIKNKRRKRRKK